MRQVIRLDSPNILSRSAVGPTMLLALLVSLTGCQDLDGQSQLAVTWIKNRLAQKTTASPNPNSPAAMTIVTPKFPRKAQTSTETPEAAAEAFFEALRFADEGRARSLLTSAAQVAVQRQQRPLRFHGSPAAIYHVGEVEYPDDSIAHVWCTWCDASRNNHKAARMVLILRNELPGWRTAGLVFLDERGEYGDIIDFESTTDVAVNR